VRRPAGAHLGAAEEVARAALPEDAVPRAGRACPWAVGAPPWKARVGGPWGRNAVPQGWVPRVDGRRRPELQARVRSLEAVRDWLALELCRFPRGPGRSGAPPAWAAAKLRKERSVGGGPRQRVAARARVVAVAVQTRRALTAARPELASHLPRLRPVRVPGARTRRRRTTPVYPVRSAALARPLSHRTG
jgi:hypothetical protein